MSTSIALVANKKIYHIYNAALHGEQPGTDWNRNLIAQNGWANIADFFLLHFSKRRIYDNLGSNNRLVLSLCPFTAISWHICD